VAYDRDDAAVLLEDFGGTVRPSAGGADVLGILRETDVFDRDGQGAVKLGEATIRILSGSLDLGKQMLVQYRDDEAEDWRTFRVRDWQRVGGGTYTDLIVAEEKA
jgi:hypothetical protein